MNCTFCQSIISSEDMSGRGTFFNRACHSQICKSYTAGHHIKNNELIAAYFRIYKPKFSYIIWYHLNDKIMEFEAGPVVNGGTFDWKTIFKVPYESINITPQNVESKLPTLLTFL